MRYFYSAEGSYTNTGPVNQRRKICGTVENANGTRKGERCQCLDRVFVVCYPIAKSKWLKRR